MKLVKLATLTLGISLTLCSISCSKAQNKASDTNATFAQNVVNLPVYSLKSVQKSDDKGKASDFIWTQDDKEVKFSEFTKGKWVFLNFWATWCPPCRKEIPDIISIANDMKDKPFVILGIACENNPQKGLDLVKKFYQNNNMNYPIVINNNDLGLASAYGGVESIPTTFIIDPDGNIATIINGFQTKDEYVKAINAAMKK